MQFREHAQPSTKVLTFHRPPTGSTDALSVDPGRADVELPFDVAALRRPVPVTATAAPRVSERDALAHDARNALASLELLSDLLAEPGVLAPEHQRYARDLKAVKETAAVLIGKITALTEEGQLPAGGVPVSNDPVFVREPLRPQRPAKATALEPVKGIDAATMVEDCLPLLSAVAGPLVRIEVLRDRTVGVSSLTGEEMTRVLMNLVKNSSEAMPKGGDVTISVRQLRSSVILQVKDTGPGIPAHALGQVFQAGFTSKAAPSRWPASDHHGLGLAIVRNLVEEKGGSVRVSSALGKGATFEIKLPCR